MKVLQPLLQMIIDSTHKLTYLGNETKAEFKRSYLKQDQITYNHGKIINIYIVYEISKNYNISSY